MSFTTRQTLIRYAIAPALVILIVLFKLLIGAFIPEQQSFLLFFAVVTMTAWYGGVGPGLVSAILSAFFANLLFFPPTGGFYILPTVLFQILLFFLESLFVVGLANALRERHAAPAQTMTVPPPAENRQENALALLDTFQVYAPVGLAFLDNNLRYIRINYAMAEASGLTPAVYIGKQLQDIQPGINPEMLKQIQQVAVSGSPLLDQETTVTKPTMLGMRQQHFSTSYYRVRGTDGKPLGVGAVMIDMTQRKQVEQALRESETLFRTMADTAPVMIWLADADKRRTYFNKGWLDFTGRQMEQETGDGWQENVHPDDIERFRQAYNESFDDPKPYRREYRLKRFDGAYRWILATGIPRFNSDGVFYGFIGTCIDIDDHKRQEIASQFLVQAGEILASSLDYETTLANVARLAVPTIADWCAVDMLKPDGVVERLAVAHVDPEKVKWAYELQARYPIDMSATTGLPQVLRTGEAEFYPVITEEMIEGAATDGETYQILREIGFTSVIITPLTARGQTLGALTLVTTESRRHFTENDVTLAKQLAIRAALAVDNARLYRDAQRRNSTPD